MISRKQVNHQPEGAVMNKPKRMINEKLERKTFEDIIKETFSRFRDNFLISEEIRDKIISDATKKIREQLQGLSRKEGKS
jgi:hypothetical protein